MLYTPSKPWRTLKEEQCYTEKTASTKFKCLPQLNSISNAAVTPTYKKHSKAEHTINLTIQNESL